MKTRYFKSGVLAAAAALLCAVSVVSCADDIVVGKSIDEGAYQGVHENTVILKDANTSKSVVDVVFSDGSFQTGVNLSLTQALTAPVEVKLGVDPGYLTEYNKKNGTDYLPYSEQLVTFENEGSVTIGAARAHDISVGMTIAAADDLVEGKVYAVPVAVTVKADGLTVKDEASHCIYLVKAEKELPSCNKGEDLPKGFLFFEVNDVNPLNALTFELEDGRLLWDVVVLFAANINHNVDEDRPYIQCNPNVQFLLDNNEKYLQPLRKRGIKVLLGLLGNHDQAGLAQLSEKGAKDFAAEVAYYCEAYNLDGVNYDDEYSDYPDLSHPAYTNPGTAAAARLCYETKKAMPDKLVTVFIWGDMYGTASVDGVDADEWLDVAVANYGSSAGPIGNMTKKKCSGISSEYNGGGSDLTASSAQRLISEGYGWFMGFAPNPMQTYSNSDVINKSHWQGIFNRLKGAETLYGSQLKDPTVFYKKNDLTLYRYPEDLPDRK